MFYFIIFFIDYSIFQFCASSENNSIIKKNNYLGRDYKIYSQKEFLG